jgi:hypothetical protein
MKNTQSYFEFLEVFLGKLFGTKRCEYQSQGSQEKACLSKLALQLYDQAGGFRVAKVPTK